MNWFLWGDRVGDPTLYIKITYILHLFIKLGNRIGNFCYDFIRAKKT